MTKLTYKLILFLTIGLNVTLSASEPTLKKEYTREVHKTFDVSPGVNLSVENRYGDINIAKWDKNEIQIDVLIKVNSTNEEKAQTFLEDMKIDFNSSATKVKARTIYPDNNNSWWSSWFVSGKNLDYEVHYTINAPENMSTSLINKYGNINQASISGDCDIVNKYGNIFLNDISGDLDLNLGYGKAAIGAVGNAKMQVKYSTIKMEETNNLEISTKYSSVKIKRCGKMNSYTKYDDYSIESIGSLKNDGKYDEFEIGTIGNINIDTKYTDVKINMLQSNAIFETRYGGVNIISSGNNLEKISINSKYTGYAMDIVGDFNLDFEGSRSDFHLGQPNEKYSSHKDGNDLTVRAFRGNKEGGAMISVYMRYGGLNIK